MRAMPALPKPHNGFTLVEMLVVAAMMAIVATAVLPMADIASVRGKERELRRSLLEIRSAIDAYKRFVDEARPPSARGTTGYPPDLQSLVQGLPDTRPGAPTPRIVWLRRLPRDPFAPTDLAAEQTWGLRSYDSPADAPRAGADVYDVYSLSTRRGSNGIWLRQW